jgi:CHAT domain-containing protein
MQNRHHKPFVAGLLGCLFLCSLILSLCLVPIRVPQWQEFREAVNTQYPTLDRDIFTSDPDLYLLKPISRQSSLKTRAEGGLLGLHLWTPKLPENQQSHIAPLVQCPKPEVEANVLYLLNEGVLVARRLRNARALSFALGNLAHIHECRHDYRQALQMTKQAERVALTSLSSKDIIYLLNWQSGRILKAQNQIIGAIKAYEAACESLEDISSNILIANKDLQFEFRETIEPIYRQLIELKLGLEDNYLPFTKQNKHSQNLISVLDSINYLRVAELQNYFFKKFVVKENNQKKQILIGEESATAVFSFMILEDRTAIIVSLPSGENKLKWINIDSTTLREEINEFRKGLGKYADINYNPQGAKKLYELIINPFENDLESSQIKTLVFIPDGCLRSIPMGPLYDGKKFLVEKYAIAVTPSLSLTNTKTTDRQNLRVLAMGLTKDAKVDGRRYEALTNVAAEISQVEAQMPGSKHLLDENFTRDRLQTELSQTVYPVIHIATHGRFGNIPEDTFLITGNNGKLTLSDLDKIIRSVNSGADTVDLLTLTACETAVGDDHAALGLAGVAIQAGVRSSLASLWSVHDASTVKLVTKFYQEWRNPGVSKAQALQKAQKEFINRGGQYAHPAYWAAFILVGNWL